MKKIPKSIISVLIALTIVIGLIPASAFAANSAKSINPLTAQLPKGPGSSADNPVICNSFTEFKAAMEDEHTQYVVLGSCNEVIPAVEGSGLLPGAISVRGFKTLYLTGNTVFRAPASSVTGYCDFDALLYNTYPQTFLRIYGPGSLTYRATSASAKNAVLSIANGNVYIYGGTLTGYCNGNNYGRAIWQDLGDLTVYGGYLIGETAVSGGVIDAAHLENGRARIESGRFHALDRTGGTAKPYGLSISKEATAILQGGAYNGILLPTQSTPLSNYMDKDVYTPLSNGSWFNPESEYSQEFLASGKDVEIARFIQKIDVNINSPCAGAAISTQVYNIPAGCYVEDVKWYEDGQLITEGTFAPGKSYKVEIYFVADSNGRFSTSLSSTTINYQNAATGFVTNNITDVYLTLDFGKCPTNITEVELTIDTPKQHTSPDQSATCASNAYKQALEGDNVWDVPIYWEESDNGTAWTQMNANSTFTIGKHYRVSVDIMPAQGYQFAIDPQIEPDVSGKINGYQSEVLRHLEEDPRELICVRYDFGILNDTIIEQIDIDGVTEPVVGENPSYSCAISGIGYSVNTAYSNNTYIIDGIGWKDITDDKWLRPTDTFEIGHQYKVYIDVKTDSGYEFYTSGNSHRPEGWGYINDNYATFGVQMDAQHEQSLSWAFTCAPKTVKSISVTGLDIPTDGFTPDFSAVTDSEYYTVESIVWTDYENNTDMTSSNTFTGGNKYWVLVTVTPKEIDGNRLCKFVPDKTVAHLNGIEVKKVPGDSWQEVVSTNRHVRIFYTYEKAANEVNYFVSGTVTSTGSETDPVTVQLFAANAGTPAYETVVTGNRANYYIAGVFPGTYTMKVTKADHHPRELTITVDQQPVIQDVTLSPTSGGLPGDLDNNGVVDEEDAIYLLQFLLMPDLFPVSQDTDFDNSSQVDEDDAIYLLQYLLMPDLFPL